MNDWDKIKFQLNYNKILVFNFTFFLKDVYFGTKEIIFWNKLKN